MTADSGQIERGTRDYRRANLALFIAGFVTFSTLYTIQPLLPLLAVEFSVSPAASSLALSVATFALAWMLPVSGSFSDAYGRRMLMGIAMVITSLLALASALIQIRFFAGPSGGNSAVSIQLFWGFIAQDKSWAGILLYLFLVTGLALPAGWVTAIDLGRLARLMMAACGVLILFLFSVSLTVDRKSVV